MAEWRPVNIATITEEKVEGEEVGEDGMVETIIPTEAAGAHRGRGPPSASDFDGDDRRPSLERPSSLVEKDVEEGEEDNQRSISSVLSSISFDNEQPSTTTAAAAAATPHASTLLPRTTLPRSHPAARRSSSPGRMTLPRAGSRASGFTMNLSEKFVTELSFYDPWGSDAPLQSPVILLGVFLATDQIMGDHSIYKVSPVSPLAALKIRPQDRLLKINGVSLAGWSHACVVDFVKSLTLSAAAASTITTTNTNSATNTTNSADTPTDLTLSMELRRVGRSVRSPQEAPPSRILEATLRIKRKRATVTAVQQREGCVRHRSTLPRRISVAHHGFHLSTCLADSGVAGLEVRAGDQTAEGHFLFHSFDVSSTTSTPPSSSSSTHNRGRDCRGGDVGVGSGGGGGGGDMVVVVETAEPRAWFLHASSQSSVALMYAAAVEVEVLMQEDVRFFCLVPEPNEEHVYRLQNIATGSFLSVTSGSVGLVARGTDGTLPNSTLLHVPPC